MSGNELIDMIVKQCEREKIPPTDTAIVNKLRAMLDLGAEADKEWARKQLERGEASDDPRAT
jgi:hypothetical protein